jgi:hypothetical protein
MGDVQNLKVRIRNEEGKYLSISLREVWFTDDPKKAQVFDYHRHHVAEQLQDLKTSCGMVLEAEPIEPTEIFESCDLCNRLAMPFFLFFDGKNFLCRDCRRDEL